MDSEVVVHRLAQLVAPTRRPSELADALQGVEGAYSLIVAIGDTLLAARDPTRLATARDRHDWATASCVAVRDVRARHRRRD